MFCVSYIIKIIKAVILKQDSGFSLPQKPTKKGGFYIQEEVENRTVMLSINSTELTTRVLKFKVEDVYANLIKIVLFTVSVESTLLLLPCKFVCLFGTMLLSKISFPIFTVALLTMLFFGETGEGFKMMFLAFMISPYGIPMVASWLIGVVDGIRERIRLI